MNTLYKFPSSDKAFNACNNYFISNKGDGSFRTVPPLLTLHLAREAHPRTSICDDRGEGAFTATLHNFSLYLEAKSKNTPIFDIKLGIGNIVPKYAEEWNE